MTAEGTTTREWAFILALVGGVLILAGGLMGGLMMSWMLPFGGGHPMGAWNGGAAPTWFAGMALWVGLWGVGTGILVIVAATRLRQGGPQAKTWGVVAIVAGAMSLLAMGGWMVGAVAAIVGGALALTDAGPGLAERRAT